jgi:hypothetical protein
MKEYAGQRLQRMALSLVGLVAALLLGICLSSLRSSAASAFVPAAGASNSERGLGCASLLTETTPFTIYLPLVMNARDCRSYIFDDFSDPASGWDTGTFSFGTFYYDHGVYRMTSSGSWIFIGSSPEWMVPDNAVIRVNAWIDNAPQLGLGFSPAIGLVYGLGFFPYGGQMLWVDWYEFRVSPREQYYSLRKWRQAGEYYDVLTSGNSSAIFPDLSAVQALEVQRNGNTVTLLVNGTVLGTVTDGASPYLGPRSVGVGAGDFYSAAFDNFEISVSGCITNTE